MSINPGVNEKDGKLGEAYWFDWKRLEVLDTNPVMPHPKYESPGTEIGAADKAAPSR